MNIKTAFVTGATGLLGSNLVRLLASRGVRVRALARSGAKAKRLLGDVDGVEIIVGDMTDVSGFAPALAGVDVVFHVAAYFRDNYKGGSHKAELTAVNVEGTAALADAARAARIPRLVHASSIAVLDGAPGSNIDETCDRRLADADDYYASKILAEKAIDERLAADPEFWAVHVLPGWMWGPGDDGPTSSGQLALDVALRRLPGLTPGSFSLVDARDVAEALVAAAEKGRRGERYLAAGRHMTMPDLIPMVGRIAGAPTPRRLLPTPLLWLVASQQELWSRMSGRPALISFSTLRVLLRENGRSHYDHQKTRAELGIEFRPVEVTIADTLAWYRAMGRLAA